MSPYRVSPKLSYDPLTPPQFPQVDCVVADSDYRHKLFGATLVPMALVVLVLLFGSVRVCVGGGGVNVLDSKGVKW